MNLLYRVSHFLPEVDENSGAGSKRIFLLANYYYFGVEMLKEKKGVFTLVAVWFREPIETGRIDDARVGAPRRRDDELNLIDELNITSFECLNISVNV